MPDIAMCCNHVCPSCKECYRYRAIPSEGAQAVAQFEPKDGEDQCGYFYPISTGARITEHGGSGFDIIPGEDGIQTDQEDPG